MKKIVFILLLALFAANSAHAMEVFLFQTNNCPACDRMFNFLMKISEREDSIILNAFYIDYDANNKEMLDILSYKYGVAGVDFPIVFIDDTSFIGYNQKLKSRVAEKIDLCIIEGCYSPPDVPLSASFRAEYGNPSYIESYKTGRGIFQGMFLVCMIIIIAYLYTNHQHLSRKREESKRKKMGKRREIRKVV